MQYIIVSGHEDQVYETVGVLLKSGWKLQGGISSTYIPPGYPSYALRDCDDDDLDICSGLLRCHQAMIHDDDHIDIDHGDPRISAIAHSMRKPEWFTNKPDTSAIEQ